MTELERYISSNLEAFDCEPVPEGGKERFMNTTMLICLLQFAKNVTITTK